DGVLQWQAFFDQTNTTLWEKATWVETDNAGNIIVTGTLMSGFSNPVVAASIVEKFNSAGTLLWRQVFESSFDGSQTKKVLIDENNNIYILGTGINGSNGLNLKVKKLSPEGTPLWTYFNAIGMPLNFKFTPDNGILVIGRGITGSVNGYAKLDRNGNPLWTLGGVFSTTVGDAGGDASGNTYIVNLEYIFNPTQSIVKKLNPAGTEVWSSNYTIAAQRLEVGTDNMPVICGYPNQGSFGSCFVKFNQAGGLVWANMDADSTFSLMLHAQLKMDSQNNIYLAAGTMTQMAVCKVKNNGSSHWTIAVPGAYANGIDIGNDFSVYVVGGNTSGATIRILQAGITSVTGNTNNVPSQYSLSQNFPNPFNPSTKITFGMSKSGNAELTVFDITGKAVKTLLNKQLSAGTYTVDFNASELPSGAYFYRLEANGFSETRKMLLTK
ncbi:MAG: T9SS type A sorting domain-containing protein, partial [Ignavibacteria bacterium]